MPLHSQPDAPPEIQLETAPPSAVQPPPPGIAPLWHTLLLVAAILGFSAWGAIRSQGQGAEPMSTVTRVRLGHYALTGLLELVLVAWVWFGLRLRRLPFRALFGTLPRSINDITKEIGIAALFWIVSMTVLGTAAFTWNATQTAIYKQQQAAHPNASAPSPQQQQVESAKKLMTLAPANALEVAAWAVLCLLVGFSEETVFRGYLQGQFFSLSRLVPVSVLASAVIFGAAHGYEGFRGIFLITIYGGLFSVVTLMRRSLFPGMIAHAWHDFFTGMALAAIRESHLLEHLPKTP